MMLGGFRQAGAAPEARCRYGVPDGCFRGNLFVY